MRYHSRYHNKRKETIMEIRNINDKALDMAAGGFGPAGSGFSLRYRRKMQERRERLIEERKKQNQNQQNE